MVMLSILKALKNHFLSLVLCLLTFHAASGQISGAYAEESEIQKAERMKWYEDARFGMFIHWGAYSQLDGEYKGKEQKDPKGEWIMRNLRIPVAEYGEQIASQFDPENFDADAWVQMAKNAGMKYLVITTKHHDGFALFKSATSDYNIVDTADFRQDIIKALADACEKYGLRFGIYYSQAQDWYHPGGFIEEQRWDEAQNGTYQDYFKNLVKGQVTELFTDYGDISLIWWDSARAVQDEALANRIGKELVKLQPGIIVNSRLSPSAKGDFNSFEQVIPGVVQQDYNELCLTHNRSWSYRESDENWKSPQFILKTLTHMTSLGSNFLFNVGPDSQGNFPPHTVETLSYISDWMKGNSKSIYNTQKSPFYKLAFGEASLLIEGDKHTLFLYVYDWPKNGVLEVNGIDTKGCKAYILQDNSPLTVKQQNNSVILRDLPAEAPHEAVSVIALEFEDEPVFTPGYIEADSNNTIALKPENALFTIKPQFDCIPEVISANGESYITNWKNCHPHPRFKNTGNQAHWKVEVKKAGNYSVIANLATNSAENILSISASKKLKKQLPNTGGLDSFQEIDLGTLYLEEGLNTITLTGGSKQEIWDEVNIGTIYLNH